MNEERNYKLIGSITTVVGLVVFFTSLWIRSVAASSLNINHTSTHSILFIFLCLIISIICFFIGKKYGDVIYNTVAGGAIVLAILLVIAVRMMEGGLLSSTPDLIIIGLMFCGVVAVASGLAAFGIVSHQNANKID